VRRLDAPRTDEVQVEQVERPAVGARLDPHGEEQGAHRVEAGVVGVADGVAQQALAQEHLAGPDRLVRAGELGLGVL